MVEPFLGLYASTLRSFICINFPIFGSGKFSGGKYGCTQLCMLDFLIIFGVPLGANISYDLMHQAVSISESLFGVGRRIRQSTKDAVTA